MGPRSIARVLLAALAAAVLASCLPAPAPAPTATVPPKPEVPAASPDYGVHAFIWNQPATTERDLQLIKGAQFHWQKSLFQWREIEPTAKGQFNWTEADRVAEKVTHRAAWSIDWRLVAPRRIEPCAVRAGDVSLEVGNSGDHSGPNFGCGVCPGTVVATRMESQAVDAMQVGYAALT